MEIFRTEVGSTVRSIWDKIRYFLRELKFAPIERTIQVFFHANFQKGLIRKYHLWKSSFRPGINEQLEKILSAHQNNRAVIIFLPGLDWRQQLFQRPQQLALALAKKGALVFYNQLKPLERSQKILPLADRLFVCSIPLEHFSSIEYFITYTMAWNRKFLLKFDQPFILYDYLDDVSTFHGDSYQFSKDHQELLRTADIVTVTAQCLLEDAQKIRNDMVYVPNGADFSHFDIKPGIDNFLPEDITVLVEEGKPFIGYYGAFANWFDYELLSKVASAKQDFTFILIGADPYGTLKQSGLLEHINIHYLGPKPYQDLPHYLACFDVAILPFKINTITQSTSPIKLFEYYAGGKPVVSTPLKEVVQFPYILIGQDYRQFSQKIDEALILKSQPDFIQGLQRTAQENTWGERAETILRAIEIRKDSHQK